MKVGTQTMTNGFGVLIVVLLAVTYLLYLRHGQPENRTSLGATMESAQAADLPGPSPDLGPRRSLEVVMAALQQNDSPRADAGIETAFRFASPGNRMSTGPLSNFRRLVRAPVFAPLIDHQSAEVEVVQRRGDQALLLIRIIAHDGSPAVYEFVMTRQYLPPYQGCWMTDGARRVMDATPEGAPLPPALDPAGTPDGQI